VKEQPATFFLLYIALPNFNALLHPFPSLVPKDFLTASPTDDALNGYESDGSFSLFITFADITANQVSPFVRGSYLS